MNVIRKNSAAALFLFAAMVLEPMAVLATTSLATNTPPAATATRTQTVTDAGQQQLRQSESMMSEGREAMSDIVAAHQLLTKQHSTEAGQYLDKARALLTRLKSEVAADKENTTGLIPIYTQLGVKEGVEITEQIKREVNKTHLDAIRGKHKKVVEALKDMDVELQYSFVDLPVAATLEKVESALKSLSEKNLHKASEILSGIGKSLVHDSILVNAEKQKPAS